MKYRAYRTKSDNAFHFQFMTDGGDTVLQSGPYQEKEACFDAIRAVIAAAGNPANYSQETNNEGQSYFVISAGGNEVARSIGYGSAGDVTTAMALTQKEGPGATAKGASTGGKDAAKKTSTTSSKSTSSTNDDYKPLAFYEGKITGVSDGFDRFEDSGEYYFTYNLDGLVLLISEGYSSENSRENGIKSVTKNMPEEVRYQFKQHENGKHYFNLRAGNNQEIATSRWFDSGKAAESGAGLLRAGGKGGGKLKAMFGGGGKNVYKDYKPLAFYQERIKGDEFGFESFTEDDKHYFSVNYEGKPVLISETYQSEKGRDNGISSVKRNVKKDERFVKEQHSNGKYYFRLLAGNKQEIATSVWFDDKKERDRMINWLASTGGTRRRKKAVREKTVGEREYAKQGAPYPCSSITYDTFKSGGNGKYYFVFKDKEGKAILINGDVRGYVDVAGVDAAIDQVLKFGPDAKNYESKISKTGKHYFFIKNDEGKSVARGSLFYADKAVMDASIAMLACGAGVSAAAVPAAKAVAAKSGGDGVTDDYLPCEAYKGKSNFHSFFNEARNEHYFAFNNADGKTMLRSEGYTNAAGRDNGIASVRKNSSEESRWSKATALNGKYHYFALKAGNHQEIGRSCYYDSAEAMQVDYDWTRGGDSILGVGAARYEGEWRTANAIAAMQKTAEAAAVKTPAPAPTPVGKESVVDDYLSCGEYAGPSGFHTFYFEDRKEYYFAYNNDGGQTMLRSEGYTSAAGRDNGIESVKKNAPIDERWGTDTALNGKYHFYYLKAGNHQEIARSCYYDSAAAMQADYDWTRGGDSDIGAGAAMFAGAWMTGNAISSRKQEEENARLAAEAKAKAEAEAEAKARAEEEAKRAADAKAKARAEEEARRAAEAKAKAEEETRLAAVAKAKAAEDARLAAAAAAAAAKAKEEAEAKKKAAAPVDDYLPCERYAGDAGFHKFTDEESGEHYFAYNNSEGKTYLRSEGYKTVKARDNGIESVKKNSPIEKHWGTATALNDRYHYYFLKAANHQEIARSCYYKDKAAMLAAMGWIQGGDSGIGKTLAAGAALGAAAIAATPVITPEPTVAATPPPPHPKKKVEKVAVGAAAAGAAAMGAMSGKKKAAVPPAAVPAAAAATRGGMGWLLWALGALALIALLWFLLRSCNGCGKAVVPVKSDTELAAEAQAAADAAAAAAAAAKVPLCLDGEKQGLTPNSLEYNLANFLADPQHSFPKTFDLDQVIFRKNSSSLTSAGKKQLDNVVAALKACGSGENGRNRFEIKGYINGERTKVRGSKETPVSTDEDRARSVYQHLKKAGISEGQMEYSGGGEGATRSAKLIIRQ